MNFLFSFIPKRINNGTIVAVYELLRRIQKLIPSHWQEHLAINRQAIFHHLSVLDKNNGYVENQNAYTDMPYGKYTMQYSGCEIFAVYNATQCLMQHPIMDLPELISCFEKDGMALNGKFGTSPKALRDFLESKGFATSFATKEADFSTLAMNYPCLIFTMYNDRDDIRKEIHTIHISKKGSIFTAHNVYCNGKTVGPFTDFNELVKNINGGKAKGISLIGVKTRQ